MPQFFWVVGVLLMVLSGGCGLYFVADIGLDDGYVVFVLPFSGLPFIAGLTMFFAARGVIKREDKAREQNERDQVHKNLD